MKLSGCFRLQARAGGARRSQQGYMLLVILLMLALLMIALMAVAPRIAQQIRRDREEETIHRGAQYARAIRLFYRKFGRYPTSLDELVSTNRIRFLRKKYKDPLSPNGDWRIIHLGEAKVAPTGFGSQPAGGSTPGQPGAGPGGTIGAFGQPGAGTGTPGGLAQPGIGPGGTTGPGQAGSSTTGAGGTGSSSSGSTSSGSTGSTFGGGAIVGVAPLNNGTSIKELNGKNHYNEWEFVYDPRLDLTNRQMVLPGGVPAGAPGTPQPGPGGPATPSPMNPR